jgi:fructose-specific phosphotransferase system IIC component
MVTFAERSAYDPASETGAAGFYMLIIPAIIAAGYITWLKKKHLQSD